MIPKQGRETIFLFIIPAIIIVLAFIYDPVLTWSQNKRVTAITEDIINEVLTTNVTDVYDRVESLYQESEINTEMLDVTYEKDENNNVIDLYIFNRHPFEAFSGQLFGTSHYWVETVVHATISDGNITIEEISAEDFPRDWTED